MEKFDREKVDHAIAQQKGITLGSIEMVTDPTNKSKNTATLLTDSSKCKKYFFSNLLYLNELVTICEVKIEMVIELSTG